MIIDGDYIIKMVAGSHYEPYEVSQWKIMLSNDLRHELVSCRIQTPTFVILMLGCSCMKISIYLPIYPYTYIAPTTNKPSLLSGHHLARNQWSCSRGSGGKPRVPSLKWPNLGLVAALFRGRETQLIYVG